MGLLQGGLVVIVMFIGYVSIKEAAAASLDEKQKFLYELLNYNNKQVKSFEAVPTTKPDQVEYLNGLGAMSADTFTLVLQSGQSDYANCAGTYVMSTVTHIRGRPVYLNSVKQRIIFFNGYG